ncbi:MAG: hypothetical protein WD314_02435 [Trueperaceae bacterium]
MALERYSSIDQANSATPEPLDAPSALARMLELVSLAPANCPQLFEPGIYRFRSLDQANEAREEATARRMRMLRAVERR